MHGNDKREKLRAMVVRSAVYYYIPPSPLFNTRLRLSPPPPM